MPPVFRFAPSPNGYLHLGHAYSALLNFDPARRAGGRLLLRIEDIDTARCRPEFEAAIYEDLAWLGIAWETPVRRQSEHLAEYRDALEKLSAPGPGLSEFREPRRDRKTGGASGRRTRPGRATPTARRSIPGAAKSLSPDERARLLESGAPYALRLDMAAACARAGDLGWIEHGEGPDGETGVVAARPRGLGRRHPGAQGDADQLSSLGGDRRRPAGGDAMSCGARTCSGRPASTGCCSSCSACRSRPTATTASSATAPGESCRSRPRPPACANFAAGARRRPTSAAWSACLDCPAALPKTDRKAEKPASA